MIEMVEKQWGAKLSLSYEINNSKVWVMSKDARCSELALPVVSKGIYFGYIEHDGLRLSIEGSQIVGKAAKKNVLELNEKEMQEWFNGLPVEKECAEGYLILKYKEDFIGCGKSNGRIIWNSVPKERRVRNFKKA